MMNHLYCGLFMSIKIDLIYRINSRMSLKCVGRNCDKNAHPPKEYCDACYTERASSKRCRFCYDRYRHVMRYGVVLPSCDSRKCLIELFESEKQKTQEIVHDKKNLQKEVNSLQAKLLSTRESLNYFKNLYRDSIEKKPEPTKTLPQKRLEYPNQTRYFDTKKTKWSEKEDFIPL